MPVDGTALFRTAGRGIAMPNAGPNALYWRDAPYGITTESEGRQAVRELAAKKVDFVKIWVDDRNKTVTPLPPSLYRPIIAEAHTLGLRVIAHVYYLADAKELLRAGIDGFAHGIRDLEVDDEIMAAGVNPKAKGTAAKDFVAFLMSPANNGVIKTKGMERLP